MDINFDSLPRVSGGSFKFTTVGTSLRGTLVGKKQKPDQFKPGQEVTIIEVKRPDGVVVTHFCNADVAREIAHVKVGQYISITFTKQLPPKSPTVQGKKIIEVCSDPKLVDTAWLAEQAENDEIDGLAEDMGGTVVSNEPSFVDDIDEKALNVSAMATPAPAATPVVDELETIKQLAKLKITGTTDLNFRDKVMEATGIAFIPMNYGKIIEMLK